MNQHIHLGNEKVSTLLLKYSIPAIVAMLVNALYNIVDRIYVGRGIGTLALTGVTICGPIMNMIVAFTLLVGVGAAALISINLGRQNHMEAEKILGNAFTLLIIFSAIIMIVFYLLMNQILVLFGTSQNALPYARKYLQIILIGTVFQSVGSGLTHSIRTDGKPKLSMLVMLIGIILNVILSPIFIYVIKLGVAGAALGTIIAQAVTAGIVLFYFTKGKSGMKLKKINLLLDRKYVFGLLAIGSAPFATQLSTCLLNIVLNRQLSIYSGDTAISAMGVVSCISLLLMMPIFGLNQGLQPILGYNYGANRSDRVIGALKLAVIWSSLITIVGYALILIFSKPLMHMFSKDDEELIAVGVKMLFIYLLGMPFVGFQLVGSGCFSALGKPKHALFLSLLKQVFLLIPLLYILPVFYQYQGILFAGPISDAGAFLIIGAFVIKLIRQLKQMSSGLEAVHE
jgi:putative efflux protein, MATE family